MVKKWLSNMEVGNFKEKFYKVWNYESQFMIKLGLINFQHPGSLFLLKLPWALMRTALNATIEIKYFHIFLFFN